MKRLLVLVAMGAMAGCRMFGTGDRSVATAFSPDGKNVIRLWTEPLAYEVERGGVTVVGRSQIGMKIDGRCLCETMGEPVVSTASRTGSEASPVYKKVSIDLSANETLVDFGDWAVRLVARNDGVAYRFETKRRMPITVNCEKATVNIPCSKALCTAHRGGAAGCEETVSQRLAADQLVTGTGDRREKFVYLPLEYEMDGKTVVVTESDVYDYPIWNLVRATNATDTVFHSLFSTWPKAYRNNSREVRAGGAKRERNWIVTESTDYLVKTAGTRTFPWRTFILADKPSQICEADIVRALARPAAEGADFSWVKPGKVAWDWWNAFDNIGDPQGCTTKTYERFIDFAAKHGVEYVIFDEGWSEKLNIWKFHPNVDVPHLIAYAKERGVGIILWMAWAQIEGDEEHVAQHFAQLGAKGFKVDFMDRGDAEVERFLWKFAEACRKNKMLIDYHGAHRPTGMSRAYPNVLNYEGIHGLEQMKFFRGQDIIGNDVRCVYTRMAAGPMDYTPGAMDNYAVGTYPSRAKGFDRKKAFDNPGSEGTRARQMAMMALYEAPLQMLCDSPTKYEKNPVSFAFMAATPVVWDATVGLGGTPDTYAAIARKAKDGAWYAAGIGTAKAQDVAVDTAFLGAGSWRAEIFRDAADSDEHATHYAHEARTVHAGEILTLHMAKGGGFIIRFTK